MRRHDGSKVRGDEAGEAGTSDHRDGLADAVAGMLILRRGARSGADLHLPATRLNSAVKEAAITRPLPAGSPAAVQARAFQRGDRSRHQRRRNRPSLPARHAGRGFRDRYDACATRPPPRQCRSTASPRPPVARIPGPGDYIQVTGYYVFQPITSQIIRFLPQRHADLGKLSARCTDALRPIAVTRIRAGSTGGRRWSSSP